MGDRKKGYTIRTCMYKRTETLFLQDMTCICWKQYKKFSNTGKGVVLRHSCSFDMRDLLIKGQKIVAKMSVDILVMIDYDVKEGEMLTETDWELGETVKRHSVRNSE